MAAGKRPYHHGDLRAALLRAGETMLETVGAEALSLRDLARQVGVSNNAPRRHFATKQDFLEALALRGFEQLGRTLDEALAQTLAGHSTQAPADNPVEHSADNPADNPAQSSETGEADFETRLLSLARANIRFALHHRELIRLMFVTKQRDDVSPELLRVSYQGLSAAPATMQYGQSTGAVVPGNPEQLALTVFSAVEGLISLSVDGKLSGVPLDVLVETVLMQILVGLRPR